MGCKQKKEGGDLCPIVASQAVKIVKLERRLAETNDRAKNAVCLFADNALELEAENERLRGLFTQYPAGKHDGMHKIPKTALLEKE